MRVGSHLSTCSVNQPNSISLCGNGVKHVAAVQGPPYLAWCEGAKNKLSLRADSSNACVLDERRRARTS